MSYRRLAPVYCERFAPPCRTASTGLEKDPGVPHSGLGGELFACPKCRGFFTTAIIPATIGIVRSAGQPMPMNGCETPASAAVAATPYFLSRFTVPEALRR